MKPLFLNAVYDWTEQSVSLVVTPSPEARQAFFYVQEVGHYYSLPRYMTEREHLDSYLIVYTAGGRGELTYGGRTHELRAGDAFFIDCRAYQAYRTDPNDLWELIWVHLNGATVRGYYDLFMKKNRSPVIKTGPQSRLPGGIEQLIRLQQERDIRTEALGSELLAGLLTELLLLAVQARPEASGQPEPPAYIAEIRDLLDRRLDTAITLDELERQFAVSKYHLQREFKRYVGLSPIQYHLNVRITRAKELLKHSELPVAEIADSLGFANVSHFIGMFRKQEETTPLAYRKRWKLQL